MNLVPGQVVFAFSVHDLPLVNALLNATATLLLLVGWGLIKRRRETAHRWTMLAALVVSAVFFTCYLIYHAEAGHVRFEGPLAVRRLYLLLLASHVILAACVPPLAMATVYLGLRDQRQRHRRLARWTFPIWLYVSVTGVAIYLMLYQFWPPAAHD